MTISRREMFECAEREARFRRRVYPRLIQQGKMTQEFADRQVAVMAAIAEHFRDPPAQREMFSAGNAK